PTYFSPTLLQPDPTTARTYYSPTLLQPDPTTARPYYSPTLLQPDPTTARPYYSPTLQQKFQNRALALMHQAMALTDSAGGAGHYCTYAAVYRFYNFS
uniref:Deleted in azoospermia-like n=1 Tax=Macrostomum lignano TaxID=282301 RepID=A0A1I8IWY9_9PLAT